MRAKGQRNQVSKTESLAFRSVADVGKWLNPSPLHRGAIQLRGFESHRRLQLKAPVEVAPSAGVLEPHSRSHADLDTPSMRPTAVISQQEISRHDLPQLPYRMP